VSSRRQRIGKVVSHRERELDKRVSALTEQRARETEAERQAERERAELAHASEARLKLAEAPVEARTWILANEWLKARAVKLELAQSQAVQARLATERARAEVQTARHDLKKLEILTSRLEAEEKLDLGRVERRLEDEVAALLRKPNRTQGNK
jgi:hypothetical protein